MKSKTPTKNPKTSTNKKTFNFPLPQDEFDKLMQSKNEDAKITVKEVELPANVIVIDFQNKKRLA